MTSFELRYSRAYQHLIALVTFVGGGTHMARLEAGSRSHRLVLVLVLAAVAVACGGGGGGGGGGNDGGTWVTFERLEADVPQGIVKEVVIRAHADRDLSAPYLEVVDEAGITTGYILLRAIMGSRDLIAVLHLSDQLSLGPHMGSLYVRFCTDSTCTMQLQGSPFELPYEIQVAPRRVAHKLLPRDPGVAFTSVPTAGWTVLDKTTTVLDNLGQTTSWTASSSQSWLTVTSSGTTGGELHLQADPAHLETDKFYRATVTITPDASSIEGSTIHVGLWVGSTGTTARTLTSAACVGEPGLSPCRFAVADPTGPFVYTNAGGTAVEVYNLYTGALEKTIADVGTHLAAMAITPDGQTLYVLDLDAGRVRILDLLTRTLASPSSWTLSGSLGGYTAPLLIRPNGVDVLLVNDGRAYLAATGEELATDTRLTDRLGASDDGTTVFSLVRGTSPAGLAHYFVDYADYGGGTFQVSWLGSATPCSNGMDVASSAGGESAFLACGSPYNILKVDAATLSAVELSGGAAFPGAVERASDGRILAVTGGPSTMDRLLVYSPAGTLQSYVDLSWGGGTGLVVSGDARIAAFAVSSFLASVPVGP